MFTTPAGLISFVFRNLYPYLGWWQGVFVVAIGLYLGLKYRAFWGDVIGFATSFPGLFLILVLLYLIVYAQVGTGLGVQNLFWSEEFHVRFFSSMGATVLLGHIGAIAGLLDPYPKRTAHRTSRFLGLEEPTFRSGLGRQDRGLGALIVAAGRSAWRGPTGLNAVRLRLFLKAARLPFLVLLALPAITPDVFSSVPPVSPTVLPGLPGLSAWLAREAPPSSFFGYLLGLVSWLSGIVAGVFFFELIIRLSEPTHIILSHPAIRAVSRTIGRAVDLVGRVIAWPIRRIGLGLVRAYREASGRLGLPDRSMDDPPFEPGWPRPHCGLAGQGNSRCSLGGCPASSPTSAVTDLDDCVEAVERQASLRNMILWFAIVYILAGAPRPFPFYDNLPPSVAICMALGALAVSMAAVAYFHPNRRYLHLAIFCAYLILVNNQFFTLGGLLSPFKDRLPHMANYYSDPGDSHWLRKKVYHEYPAPLLRLQPHPDPEPSGPEGRVKLVEDEDARSAWLGRARARNASLGKAEVKPKLVVVCVSGGAVRSAYWTAVVLEQLGRIEGFHRSVRVITGASGGMLGTACYVEARFRNLRAGSCTADPTEKGWVTREIPTRSLDELARYIALRDLPRGLLPRVFDWRSPGSGEVQEFDRGTILEQDWKFLQGQEPLDYPPGAVAGDRGRKFTDYARYEAAGDLPSLIFSPMIVEDGRLLLISNLNLRTGSDQATPDRPERSDLVVATGGALVEAPHGDGTVVRRYSLTGLEFFKLFPRAGAFRLATAVRMNATFPFVSPAVELPTRPRRRVVDAGYYDNYGVQVATAWLQMNREWLVENTSGVLLVQIRDGMSVMDRQEIDDRSPGIWERVERGFDLIFGPLQGAIRARTATVMFRNDYDIQNLGDMFTNLAYRRHHAPLPGGPVDPKAWNKARAFFVQATFENPASLIWRTEPTAGDSMPGDSIIREDAAARASEKDISGRIASRSGISPNRVVGRTQAIAMTWYLTPAEKEVMDQAFPRMGGGNSPGDPWGEDSVPRSRARRRRISRLTGLLEKLSDEGRELALKDLVQVRNHERYLALKRWMDVDHSRR